MKNAIMFVLGCSVAAVMSSQAQAEDTLCIHLYNLARVSPDTLHWATELASRVYRRAGISTRWELRSANSAESNTVDLNTSFANFSPLRNRPCLVLRLVRDLPAHEYPGALGFALPLARFGVNAEIFYRRIESQAASVGMDPYILLAYTIAHEIGHVLLRSSLHARFGIMQAHPGAQDWRAALFGRMAFLPEQAEQMRHELRMARNEELQALTRVLAP